MKKEYQKPEVELIELMACESITTDDDIVDGSMGLEDSPF